MSNCKHDWRMSGMGGQAWICRICEAYKGPRGAVTPGQWWNATADGCPSWKWALGKVYGPPVPAGKKADFMIVDDPYNVTEKPSAEQLRKAIDWYHTTRVRKPAPKDPLDVEYDGIKLRTLLDGDEFNRRETGHNWRAKKMTANQRAAVSSHWSAELRRRIEAAKERERCSVVVDLDEP